jgi:hypothetical protein
MGSFADVVFAVADAANRGCDDATPLKIAATLTPLQALEVNTWARELARETAYMAELVDHTRRMAETAGHPCVWQES